MPIVFSSATLSVDGSFQYIADSLGLERFLSFSVESPFDYERQMRVVAAPLEGEANPFAGNASPAAEETDPAARGEAAFAEKTRLAASWLNRSGGRALLLFPDERELRGWATVARAIPRSTPLLLAERVLTSPAPRLRAEEEEFAPLEWLAQGGDPAAAAAAVDDALNRLP